MKTYSIQYLRGFAAMAIVIFHLHIQLQRLEYFGPFPQWLSSGVDVFFVISGYIMWSTTIDRHMSPIEFMARRGIRVVPLYWTVTTLFVTGMFLSPNVFQSSAFSLPHVLSSYLFFPYEHPVTHALEPVVIPGWTLNYEMFFYILFAIWLTASRSTRLLGLMVTLVSIVLLRFVTRNVIVDFYTSSIILEFGFGVIVAYAVSKNILSPKYFGLIAPIFIFFNCLYTQLYRSAPSAVYSMGPAGRIPGVCRSLVREANPAQS